MPNPQVTNTTTALVGRQVLTTTDAAILTALLTFNLGSAAPLAVETASAKVANLNADTIHGNHAADIVAQFVAAPSGAIAPFCGASIPTGWLLCNGQSVSQATYANLYAVLGSTFGAGGGNFNVPDCRQRLPLGVAASGTGSALGATGGAIGHTHTYNQVVRHSHTVTITDPGHDHTTHEIPGGALFQFFEGFGTNQVEPSGYVSPGVAATGISLSSANPSGGAASGTTAASDPPWVAVNFIIKT